MFGRNDDGFGLANADAGLEMRVKWVKELRAALLPFVEKKATEADRLRAEKVLEETKEWL